RAAAALRDAGVGLAVGKQGPAGRLGVRDGEHVVAPPVPVRAVNGLGAGDAFGGALCHGLLAGWDLERILRFANAAGAYVAGQLACADAMPATADVEAMLEGVSRPPTRRDWRPASSDPAGSPSSSRRVGSRTG